MADPAAITLRRVEGSPQTDHMTPVTVSTWAAANEVLAAWARTAPARWAGYHKVQVAITWPGGEGFKARFDMSAPPPAPDLRAYLEDLGFDVTGAGIHTPTVYAVGKPYVEGKTNWGEHVEYNCRGGGHELRLFYPDLTPKELAAIRDGPARFAFAVSGDVIFFCWRFGDLPWADSTFSIWLVPEEEREAPAQPKDPNERAALSVFCVEAKTGLIAALRFMTLSPDFTRRLHLAITAQLDRPYPGEAAYMAQCKRVYAAYSSEGIARRLAVATCKGGD